VGPGYLSRYNDWLRAGRSGDRIPVGARFSAPVQTGPGAHPASYTMGTRSFLGVKRLGRGVDYPPPSSAEVKERLELYLYSVFGPSWPVRGGTLPWRSVVSGLPVRHFFVQKIRCEFDICCVSFLHSALNPSRPVRNFMFWIPFFYYLLSGAEADCFELLKILVVTRPREAHFIPINFMRTADSLKFVVLRRILIHYAIVELTARKICWRKPLRNKMAILVCSAQAARCVVFRPLRPIHHVQIFKSHQFLPDRKHYS